MERVNKDFTYNLYPKFVISIFTWRIFKQQHTQNQPTNFKIFRRKFFSIDTMIVMTAYDYELKTELNMQCKEAR